MKTPALTLALLLVGFACLQAGNALQGTLLAVRAGIEGFSTASIGMLTSGFFAGMCAGSIIAGRLISQAGHIRTFAALASLGSAAALVHLLVIHPVAWIAVRTITGICFAGLIIVVESWLNASSTASNRGRVLSIYAISSMGAGICGQLLFTSADPGQFALFVVVSVLMSVALVPISLSRAVAPVSDGEQEVPSIRRLWAFSPFGAVAMLAMGAALGAIAGLAPVYAQQMQFGQAEIGLLMAAFSLGGVVLQFPVGLLSDRVNRRLVAIVTASGAAGACLYIASVPAWPLPLALVAFFAMGGLILPTFSVIIAHVNDRAPASALVAVSGGLVLIQGIGAVAGPVAAGALMDRLGAPALMAFVAALQALVAIYGLVRIYLVEGPSADQKGDFTAVPITPVTGELEMSVYEDAQAA